MEEQLWDEETRRLTCLVVLSFVFQTRGGAFAEWDFLRGVREGWIPTLPAQNVSSVSKFGTCEQILYETVNDKSIVHEYPDPNKVDTWKGDPLDDDLVISMGKDRFRMKMEATRHRPTKEKKESTTEEGFYRFCGRRR